MTINKMLEFTYVENVSDSTDKGMHHTQAEFNINII